MEEGDGGVDEEGVAGEGEADHPIRTLEEDEPRGHGQELPPPLRRDLERHRHRPQQQRRREEESAVAASADAAAAPSSSSSSRGHLPRPLSLSLSLSISLPFSLYLSILAFSLLLPKVRASTR